jgi:hypothetical protein
MPRKQRVPLIRLGTKNLPTGQAETRLLPITEPVTDLEEIRAAANWRAPKPAGRHRRNDQRNARIIQEAKEHPKFSSGDIVNQLKESFPGITRNVVDAVLARARRDGLLPPKRLRG